MSKTIKIIYTSDVHGKITSYDFMKEKYSNFGLSRISTYLKKLKEEYLLLDNGDFLQGSPLLDYNRKNNLSNPVSFIMNKLNYQYINLGNHDFNYGPDYLNDFIKTANAKIVCANIIDSKTNKPYFTPFVIHEIDTLKIGVIGLITEYVPVWEKAKNIEGLKFVDAVSTLKEYTELLKNKTDLIICMYHGGFDQDVLTGKVLSKKTLENKGYDLFLNSDVDILLTGHQHITTLINKDDRVVIQTANNALNFGVISVTIKIKNNKTLIESIKGEILDSDDFEIDESIEELLNPLINQTNKYLDTTIAPIKTDFTVLDPLSLRIKKHPLAQLINDVQLNLSDANISLVSFPNQVRGFKDLVTLRDLSDIFVFENTIKVIEITGKILKSALEKTATYFKISDDTITINDKFLYPKVEHYNYDIYDGIEYEIKVSNKENKITKLNYQNKPVLDNDIFTLVLNDYRANAGGDYLMFKDCKVIKEYQISYVDLIRKYIEDRPNLEIIIKDNYLVKK